MKRMYRMKYINFKNPDDYEMLKQIDLNAALHRFRENPANKEALHSMFLYASSEEANHLYRLCNQTTIEFLV